LISRGAWLLKDPLLQFFDFHFDFPILREPVESLLRKNEVAVDLNLENSSA
jgi:hypothetical protein